jgi:hypothetical protein
MRARVLGTFMVLWIAGHAHAQTAAGIATTMVFPIAAQTVSFASEMTLFNPGPNALTASVKFYEANNSGAPGPKTCNDVTVSPGRSVQITLSTQCALTGTGGHFGLAVIADKAAPQVNAFYGYARVQNPQGIGFSVEGFPITDFDNQVSHATGLKRKAAAPTYQTNCFVASLDQPVSYELKLFNDSTGAQVGGTLAGSLAAFQQFRYLDVFGINGVNAPAGDLQNVRAQFAQTSGGTANLIGFCTVQDNTSFGADFRIAKSYGSPSSSFFAQGGNAFGSTALLGTLDDQSVVVLVNNRPTLRLSSVDDVTYTNVVNIVNGSPLNSVSPGVKGATIAGGGITINGSVQANQVNQILGTVSGGAGNSANGDAAVVSGGYGNTASGQDSMIPGGLFNTASGTFSFAAGRRAKATTTGTFMWADSQNFDFQPSVSNFFGVRATGGVGFTVAINPANGAVTQFCNLLPGTPSWQCTSDRDAKENFSPVDGKAILKGVAAMPISTWNFKGADPTSRALGPTAQDFYEAFRLGTDDKSIATSNLASVALAAIQGLHQVVLEKDAVLHSLERQLDALQREAVNLRERLARVESMDAEVAQLRAAVFALAHDAPSLAIRTPP